MGKEGNKSLIESLETYAKNIFGRTPGSDFKQIIKHLNKENKILEVGAGTGRIGIQLIQGEYNYTGVEKQILFFKTFKSKLKKLKCDRNKVKLLNISLEKLPNNKKYDVILFSWTVIGDFSKDKQIKIFEKTKNILSKKGICILETKHKNKGKNYIDFHPEDWRDNLHELGFSYNSDIYTTKTGIERELTVLRKQDNAPIKK
jgi:cyclopropane fatty-acyl-phospholipid synthase-like methyltransferase